MKFMGTFLKAHSKKIGAEAIKVLFDMVRVDSDFYGIVASVNGFTNDAIIIARKKNIELIALSQIMAMVSSVRSTSKI